MAEILNSESHYFNSNNSIIINTNNFKSNDLELFLDYSEQSQPSFYYKNEFNLGKVNDFEFSPNIDDFPSDDETNDQTFISESDFGDLFNYFDEPSILINERDDDDDIFNCRFQEEIQLKADNRKVIRKKKIKKRNNAVVLFKSIKDKIEFFDEIARKENDNKKNDSIKKCPPIKSICSPPPTINRKKNTKATILKEAEELWKLSMFKVSILNALLMIDYLPKCIKQNQLNLNPTSLDLVDFYQKPNMFANKNDIFYSFDFFSLLKYQELYGVKVALTKNQSKIIFSNNFFLSSNFSHQKMNYKKIMINQIHYQSINYVFKHLYNV